MMTPASSAFRSSPFSLVADETAAECWAGRANVLVQLQKLCRSWSNRADSTLDVLWANLGAGKTHALFHLKHMLRINAGAAPIVIYAEVPERDSRFIEIYRRLVSTLTAAEIADLGSRDRQPASPSIARACRALQFGDDSERRLAYDWIIGGRPGLRELKALTGIDSRIENDVDAERALHDILALAADNGRRVIVLLDEFQRLGHLGERHREALLSHVRSLFSQRPSNFSVVLAVGSRVEKTALDLLPGELKTLMGMRRPIVLPEMDDKEAAEFIRQRMAWYRPADYSGAPEFPFTSEQIDATIKYIVGQGGGHLIPRTILQVFGIIYDEICQESEAGSISMDELYSLLSSLRWDESS